MKKKGGLNKTLLISLTYALANRLQAVTHPAVVKLLHRDCANDNSIR